MMTPSAALSDFIRGWESCRLVRYLDAAGRPTIGWGHLLADNDPMQTCTQAEADQMFAGDLDARARALAMFTPDSASQQQFDALLSLAYNEGVGAIGRSTLMRDFCAGDLDGVRREFAERWHFVTDPVRGLVSNPGLIKRRAAEAAIFFDGDYSGRP